MARCAVLAACLTAAAELHAGNDACKNVQGDSPEAIAQCMELLSVEYRIPAVVIMAMVEMESAWNQFVPPHQETPGDCEIGETKFGYGLTQFTQCEIDGKYPRVSYLGTIEFDRWDGDNEFNIAVVGEQVDLSRIKNDWKYNLEIGVRHLLMKKEGALKRLGEYDANVIENWYLALAGFNGLAARNGDEIGNNPADSWARDTRYLSRSAYPYQEGAFHFIAHRDANANNHRRFLGAAIPATLPGPSAVHNSNTNAPYATATWGFGACPGGKCDPDPAQFSRHGKIRLKSGESFLNGAFPTSWKPHAVDFGKPRDYVVIPPIEVDQYSGASKIETGQNLGGTTARFRAKLFEGVNSPGPLKLEVELLRVDEANGTWPEDHLSNGAIHSSDMAVPSGQYAELSVGGLIPGCYHWRARTVDANRRRSLWYSYAMNPIAEADFVVNGSVCTNAMGVSAMACSSTPPAVTTPVISAITQTSATFTSALNNGGLTANGWFALTTAASSSVTPPILVTATGAQTIRASVASLDCGTTYTIRAAASSAVASVSSAATSFTTTPCNAPKGLAVTISGNGSVSSSPSGISCPSSCAASYAASTLVTLTASPSAGSTFGGWTGDCSGTSATCNVTLSENRFVAATFHASSSPLLSVTIDGAGTVTSSPSGINCTSSCSAPFAANTPVTLTAQPASGWLFAGWSGDCAGNGACQVTLSQSRSVRASFANSAGDQPLTVSTTIGGFVTSDPIGIDCGATCRVNYSPGATVSLTPHHATGWRFTSWGGDCSGSGACTVIMNQPRTVTAQFSTTTDQVLNLSPTGPQGSRSRVVTSPGTLRCTANANCSADTFAFGSVVNVTPIPQAGHPFTEWTGDCTGFAECALTMNEPHNVGATFTACTNDCPAGATYVHEDFRDGWPQYPEYTITGGRFTVTNDLLNVRYTCVQLPVTYHRTVTAGTSIDADVRIHDATLGAFRIYVMYDTINGCTDLMPRLTNGYALYLTNDASYSGRDKDMLVAFTDGTERTIATTPRSLKTGEWAHVRLELWPDGPMRVFIDGALVMAATDTAFRTGFINLSGGGESTDLDNVVVQSLAASFPPPAPQVFGVTPASGPAVGGTTITVTGENFVGGTTLTVGGVAATSINVLSPTTLTAVTPAHPAGSVSVRASTESASGAALEQGFTYLATAPSIPQNVRATASGASSVSVTWTPSAGADRYEISRTANRVDFVVAGSIAAPPFVDAAQGGAAYGYRVRAFAGELASSYSGVDVATVVAFADPVLQRGSLIRATHVLDARRAVNALRAYAGLSAFPFTDASLAAVRIKSVHIHELRTALDAARSALGLPAMAYATTAASGTAMNVSAMNEIRTGVE